jgi:hypothetical protein
MNNIYTISWFKYPNYPKMNSANSGFTKMVGNSRKSVEAIFEEANGWGRSDCKKDGEEFKVSKGKPTSSPCSTVNDLK